MAHKNLTNGSAQTSMSVTGSIIKSMALVFNTTRMATSMKAAGRLIKDTAKEHIGLLILKTNLEDSTLVTGTQTKNKAEAQCFTNQETDMTVCGWITIHTDKEE